MPPEYTHLSTAASLFLEDGSKIEISRHFNQVSICCMSSKPEDGDPWSGTHLMLSPDEAGWIGQQLDLTIQQITNDPNKEPPKQSEPADGTKLFQEILAEPGAEGEKYQHDGDELIEYKAWAQNIRRLAKEMLS